MLSSRRRSWFAGVGGAVALLAAGWIWGAPARAEDAAPAPAPAPQPPQDAPKQSPCLACHGDAAKAGGHLVDGAKFARSVHSGNDCADCHTGFEAHPHSKDASTMTCVDCHEDQAKAVAESVHGKAAKQGGEGSPAPGCADCHGTHDVFKASQRESRLYPLNVPKTCLACHDEKARPKGDGKSGIDPKRPRFDHDVHMGALLRDGLTVAPTCVTCHGKHGIVPSKDPKSPVHPARAAETCGACHVGIVERYRESVHGRTPRDASKTANHREPATCYDCHKPHQVKPPEGDWKIGVIQTCGGCHGDYLRTYRGTYHGRVTNMGFAQVASCDACHTAHDIRPAKDPASSVNPAHRTQTCKACHADATDRFATYPVHADPKDRDRWPMLYWADRLMSSMIVVVWCLAGVHMLLWFVRAMIDRRKILEHRATVSKRWYQRLRPAHRALHMTLVLSFLTLALTGLPLRFNTSAWSPTIYAMLGGPDAVRFLHRFAGVVTFGYFIGFVAHLVWRVRKGEKDLFKPWNSMLPRWKDVVDIKDNFRWFLLGGPTPKFDRWTYWEKFDFWAEVWGVGFIGVTGLIMWFPAEATSVMPGWIVSLAHILHSYEALLATSFIFTVHFFHANLRPGKFPLDPVFLTGRIPEHELAHERPEEYARMKADGRLETEALPPPDPILLRRAYILGGTLLCIGILLLGLMVSSLLGV